MNIYHDLLDDDDIENLLNKFIEQNTIRSATFATIYKK